MGVNLVGRAEDIDNDLYGTDLTFGFDTAVQIATEAIDRLHSTRGVAQPGDRLRGDGSPRRLDRHVLGHRGRR